MALLLIPISLFIKILIPSISMYYLSELPIYAYLVILLFVIYRNHKNRARFELMSWINTRVLICVAIVMASQLIAMIISHFIISDDPLNRNPYVAFMKLIILLLIVFAHYCVVRFTIVSDKDMSRFITGSGIGLLILLCITYLQLFYLIFPSLFSHVASFIGIFENRYSRDWYTAGSYVQTLHRINGLNPESDYLAAQLLVVFVPFILASIKNKVNIFAKDRTYSAVLFYLLLLSIIIMLFFAKTSTGILAIMIIVFSYWFMVPKNRKIYSALLVIACCGLIYLISLFVPFLKEIINVTLVSKLGGDSMNTRLDGTLGLILTWIHHPVFGVGYNNHDFYLLKLIPNWLLQKSGEFRVVYGPGHFFPILSVFFGWLAEFGTLFVIFSIVYTLKLLKDFRTICKKLIGIKQDDREVQFISAIKDTAHYFFIYYFICSLLVFNWYESIYLIEIFFFVVIRQRLKNKLSMK